MADLRGMLRSRARPPDATMNEVLKNPENRHLRVLFLPLSCPQERDRNLGDRFEVASHQHLVRTGEAAASWPKE